MSSGIPVDESCLRAFEEIKLGKKLKYVIFHIENNKNILVKSTSESTDYNDFLKELPEDDCRWAVYDAAFETKSGEKRKKLCFISWTPDGAKGREKMTYASSKSSLRNAFPSGIGHDIQATDADEISKEAMESKIQGTLI